MGKDHPPVRAGDAASPRVLFGALLQPPTVGNQPCFKVSFQRKSLLAALRQWQVSADLLQRWHLLRLSLPTPTVTLLGAHQQKSASVRTALAFPLQTGSRGHPPVGTTPLPSSVLAQEVGDLGFGEIPARAGPSGRASSAPTASAREDGVTQPWSCWERVAVGGCDPWGSPCPENPKQSAQHRC